MWDVVFLPLPHGHVVNTLGTRPVCSRNLSEDSRFWCAFWTGEGAISKRNCERAARLIGEIGVFWGARKENGDGECDVKGEVVDVGWKGDA